MPREQIRLLTGDIERLLSAGSNVAVGDSGLQKRSRALRELGAKVPVLLQIADAVDQVTGARSTEVARKLLDLLLVVRQARSSLSTAGLEGELTPVPRSGPWATPSSVHDLNVLRDALRGTGEAGFEDIRKGLERQLLSDLRLVQPIMDGLVQSGYAPRADLIALEVIPAAGSALLPELRKQLDLHGKGADVRRLKALCKVSPQEGADLCRKILAEGGRDLKPAALELLADLVPQEAEQIGQDLLARKPDQQLRAAVLRSLARSRKDEALDVLLTGIEDTSEVWHQAHYALTVTPHPQATSQLLVLLTQKLDSWKSLQVQKEPKAPNATGSKGKTKTSKREEQLTTVKEEVRRLLQVLQARRDPQCVSILLPQLKHKDTDTRVAVVEALAATNDPHALEAVAALVEDTNQAVWQTAIQSMRSFPPEKQFEILAPLASKLFITKSAAQQKAAFALGSLTTAFSLMYHGGNTTPPPVDPRWRAVLLKLLAEFAEQGNAAALVRSVGNNSASLGAAVARVFGQEAVPHLLRVLPMAVDAQDINIVETLGQYPQPGVATALVEQVVHIKSDWLMLSIANALYNLGDKSVLPRLRELRDAVRGSFRQRHLDHLIDMLDSKPVDTP